MEGETRLERVYNMPPGTSAAAAWIRGKETGRGNPEGARRFHHKLSSLY